MYWSDNGLGGNISSKVKTNFQIWQHWISLKIQAQKFTLEDDYQKLSVEHGSSFIDASYSRITSEMESIKSTKCLLLGICETIIRDWQNENA